MIAFKGGGVSSGGHRTGLGQDAGGLVAYLVRGKQRSGRRECLRAVRGHQVPTHNPWLFLKFFESTARRNKRCEKPVYHVGASAAPGEELTTEQWTEIGEDMLRSLGIEDHEALFVLHDGNDPAKDDATDAKAGQQHLHIVVNRVARDGSLWHPSWDYPKLRTAMRQAEQKHGLKVVPTNYELRQSGQSPRLSDRAVCRSRTDGDRPLVDRLRSLAGEHLREAESWTDLDQRLQPLGLAVRPAKRGGGVLVADAEGHEVSLSKILRLSGPQLTRRFGIDLRTHRLRSPEPVLQEADPVEENQTEDPTQRLLDEALQALRDEYGVFKDRDIRRQVRWHADGVELFEQLTQDAELVSLGTQEGEGLWTTQAYRETERQLWATASRLHHAPSQGLPADAVNQLLAQSFGYFSTEQVEAVRHASEGRRLALLQGLAGTGKTSMAQAIAQSYEAAGFRVVGAALSGRAADILGQETGIESRTLASWNARWQKGRQALDERTVLLVDEASMIGVRQMQQLLQRAEAQGASVILMGDPAQLRPVEPGDAFRGLLRLFPSAQLTGIRRQRHEWQRTASVALAEGNPDIALHAYAARGFVQGTDSREDAVRAVVDAAAELPKDESRLIVAFRRRDVGDLNEQLRSQHFADQPTRFDVAIRGRRFAEGDRVLFRRNESRLVRTVGGSTESRTVPEPGVRNGALGTVTTLGEAEMTVNLDSGRRVTFDPGEYTDLDYGYAVTLHAAQGATVDHCLAYADDRVDLHGIYVAGTRHRESFQLVYDRESFPDLSALIRSVSREAEPNLVLDVPQPAASPEIDRVLARLGSRRATWTRRTLETVCIDEDQLEDVLKHPDVIPLEPDLFTTRRQVLAEARLTELAGKLSRRSALELKLDTPSRPQSIQAWMEETGAASPTVLLSADRAGAADLQSRTGRIAATVQVVALNPGSLAEGSTIFVDRVQLLDVETLTELLERADEANASVVLAGDPTGHTPVTWAAGAGDAFSLLVDQHAAAEWQDQLDQAERNLPTAWIQELEASGRVSVSDDAVENAARVFLDSTSKSRLIASRRSTVRRLNETVQQLRLDRGELNGIGSRHGGTFAQGDQVVFRAGSDAKRAFLGHDGTPTDPVAPGTRGVIERVNPHSSILKLEDGRQIQVPLEYQRLELAYAQSLADVASVRMEGEVHVVLDGGFHHRTTRALQSATESADTYLHASSSVHKDGVATIAEQVSQEFPRDLAHDCSSASRRYRQLSAKGTSSPSAALDDLEELASGKISGESKADLLSRLGAPEWSALYETLDRPTTESWTDWHIRRHTLSEARRAQSASLTLEQLQDHTDRRVLSGDEAWLQSATWRQLQRLAPRRLDTLLAWSRAVVAIARDPKFLLRLVEPRVLTWSRLAFRIARMTIGSRSAERDTSIER